MQVVPAILATQVEEVQEKLAVVSADGNFATVQIDIIDGQLLPAMTVTPLDLVDLDFGTLRLDFHLMTEEPLDYVWEMAAQAPRLPVRAVQGQVERMGDQVAFLRAIKELGWQAGLALDLPTTIDGIDDNAWQYLDEILLLAVPMGSQGQTFAPQVLDKLAAVKTMIAKNQLKIKITIDGGIKPEQLKELHQAAVDYAVVGSYLWSGDFTQQSATMID